MYYMPIKDGENGITYSVDMVRFRLKFDTVDEPSKTDIIDNPFTGERTVDFKGGGRRSGAEILCARLEMKYLIDPYISIRSNTYRTLLVLPCGASTVTLGFGWTDSNNRIDMYQGFVEFNPNKCFCNDFMDLLYMIRLYLRRAELVRWDLAIDMPIERIMVSLIKDQRKYALEMKSALDKTEYLGIRNEDTRVKLYNKSLESGLDYPLTRLEITLSDTDIEYIRGKIPTLNGGGFADIPEDMPSVDKLLIKLLRQIDSPEVELRTLNPRKASKLKPYVIGEGVTVEYSEEIHHHIRSVLFSFF